MRSFSGLSVHERLHVRLEGDRDLVAPDLLYEPDPEHRMLEHFVGAVPVLGGVGAGEGEAILAQERVPARHRRLGRALGGRDPGALLLLGWAAVSVLALTRVAADADG